MVFFVILHSDFDDIKIVNCNSEFKIYGYFAQKSQKSAKICNFKGGLK